MSLAASIQKHNRATGIEGALLQLEADDRQHLIDALDASVDEVGHMAIVRGLREYGVEVTEATVRRWREKRYARLEEAS